LATLQIKTTMLLWKCAQFAMPKIWTMTIVLTESVFWRIELRRRRRRLRRLLCCVEAAAAVLKQQATQH
jgi:hypothetical protein